MSDYKSKEEAMRAFRNRYCTFTGRGVLVSYTDENGVDIDDFLSTFWQSAEEAMRKKCLQEVIKGYGIAQAGGFAGGVVEDIEANIKNINL